MLTLLTTIPAIAGISIPGENGVSIEENGAITMMVDDHHARGYLCNHSLILSVLIKDSVNLSNETLNYVTLLLGGYPEVHDYSLRLTPEGGWLCCLYSQDTTSEVMAKEIEKQLALTRYLQSIISRRWKTRLDGKYEIS